MKFREFFDRVYVINLPNRVDRRKAIEKELIKTGMPFTPVKVELFPAIRPDSAGSFKSIGYRGCFLSHLTVLKQARDLQLKNVLVMEDDLAFSDHFKEYEAQLITQLHQTNWDFVNFGYFCDQPVNSIEIDVPTLQPPSGQKIIGTHFYGVNGKVFDKLINFLEVILQRPPGHPEGGPMSTDGAFSTFHRQNPDIVRLISIPSVGGQRNSRTDIHDLKWFDRTPVFRELVTVARDLGIARKLKIILNKNK
ncbi:MAG: glycosyltransferase family 25 protein [Coleofasciculus chthonoplastes F3-SA18-01]|uniref:glycosyltransferase family 25 protein n=1 Tax=Coleofasciculus chthonoplastes TaxID=64178 RepID=UPI0032F9A686